MKSLQQGSQLSQMGNRGKSGKYKVVWNFFSYILQGPCSKATQVSMNYNGIENMSLRCNCKVTYRLSITLVVVA